MRNTLQRRKWDAILLRTLVVAGTLAACAVPAVADLQPLTDIRDPESAATARGRAYGPVWLTIDWEHVEPAELYTWIDGLLREIDLLIEQALGRYPADDVRWPMTKWEARGRFGAGGLLDDHGSVMVADGVMAFAGATELPDLGMSVDELRLLTEASGRGENGELALDEEMESWGLTDSLDTTAGGLLLVLADAPSGAGKLNVRTGASGGGDGRRWSRGPARSLEDLYYLDWPWSGRAGRNMFYWLIGPPGSIVLIAVVLGVIGACKRGAG